MRGERQFSNSICDYLMLLTHRFLFVYFGKYNYMQLCVLLTLILLASQKFDRYLIYNFCKDLAFPICTNSCVIKFRHSLPQLMDTSPEHGCPSCCTEVRFYDSIGYKKHSASGLYITITQTGTNVYHHTIVLKARDPVRSRKYSHSQIWTVLHFKCELFN